MSHYRGAIAVLCAAVLSLPAAAHDWAHPDLDGWYSGLRRPNRGHELQGFTSCCSKTDCAETDAEMRDKEWWARLVVHRTEGNQLGDWVRIPPETILDNQGNPTGSAIICHAMSWKNGILDPATSQVFCFIRPTEG